MTQVYDDTTQIAPDRDAFVLLEGKSLAAREKTRLQTAFAHFTAHYAVVPQLAVVLVGDDPASIRYSELLVNDAQKTYDLRAVLHALPGTTDLANLNRLLTDLKADPDICAISLQWPLPAHLAPHLDMIAAAMGAEKDVEGYHPLNLGRLYFNLDTFVPPTPLGGMRLLAAYGLSVESKHCLVVGHGTTVGKPLLSLLLQAQATTTVAQKATPPDLLRRLAREADFVFAAAGVPGLITGDMVKPGAVLVDFGATFVDGKMRGDVNFDSVRPIAHAVTPTPGGTGPLTRTCLMENILKAALAGAMRARLEGQPYA